MNWNAEAIAQDCGKPKKTGKGWMACCPNHDDHNPSMFIFDGNKGVPVWSCKAGCDQGELTAKMKELGYYSPKPKNDDAPYRCRRPINVIPKTLKVKKEGKYLTFNLAAKYKYENGYIGRYEHEGEKKEIRQYFRKQNDGSYKSGVPDDLKNNKPLYNKESVDKSDVIFVVEGEKCADALNKIGLVAVTSSGGSGAANQTDFTPLQGKHIVIWPDNDASGRKYQKNVIKICEALDCKIEWIDIKPLGLKEKEDCVEWLERNEGATKEDVLALKRVEKKTKKDQDEATSSKSEAQMLYDTVIKHIDLWKNIDGQGFATFKVGNHSESNFLNDEHFKSWCAMIYFKETGKPVSESNVKTVINTLSGQARFCDKTFNTYVRVGEDNDSSYIDLCNDKWKFVKVNQKGWSITDTNDGIKFLRRDGMRALPDPVKSNNIDLLWDFLNVKEEERVLVLAWIIAALRPNGPYPCIAIQGEQGTAKSTMSELLRRLTDPNKALKRVAPKDAQDLFIQGLNNHCILLDNLSGLPAWLSDTLCVLATGGGYATRRLYTDSGECVWSIKRPVILNGINDITSRPDLTERTITLNLQEIAETKRKTEEVFWSKFEDKHPEIFGAILDVYVKALGELPNVHADRLPRMADFAKLGIAIEKALNYPEGTFLNTYNGNQDDATENVIQNDLVGNGIASIIARKTEFSGTCSDWLVALKEELGEQARSKYFPQTARRVSDKIKRLKPALKRIGIDVQYKKTRDKRLWIIEKMQQPEPIEEDGSIEI